MTRKPNRTYISASSPLTNFKLCKNYWHEGNLKITVVDANFRTVFTQRPKAPSMLGAPIFFKDHQNSLVLTKCWCKVSTINRKPTNFLPEAFYISFWLLFKLLTFEKIHSVHQLEPGASYLVKKALANLAVPQKCYNIFISNFKSGTCILDVIQITDKVHKIYSNNLTPTPN